MRAWSPGPEARRSSWSGSRRFGATGARWRGGSSGSSSQLVFHDQPVDGFVRAFVADLRAGRFDGELVYRKAIRKPLEAYTKTTPPHVKAARKQAGGPGGSSRTSITTAGPEAVGETTAPPDYDHYVTQQLRPIADALLHFVGVPDFDTIADIRRPEGRQLALFGEGDLP